MKIHPFVSASLLMLLLPACVTGSYGSGHSYMKTSVCEVASHPEQFDGKTVKLSATVDSDYMHYVVLQDGNCPKNGLPIGGNRLPDSKDSPEFDAAMENKRVNGGIVSADFVGVISYTHGDFPHAEINVITTSNVAYTK